MIIALPIDAELANLRQLALIEVTVAAVALLVASVLGFVLVRVGLRPMTRLTAQTRALGPAGSSARVDVVQPRTEVGELGTAINAMLDETSAAMAQRTAAEAGLRRFKVRLDRQDAAIFGNRGLDVALALLDQRLQKGKMKRRFGVIAHHPRQCGGLAQCAACR